MHVRITILSHGGPSVSQHPDLYTGYGTLLLQFRGGTVLAGKFAMACMYTCTCVVAWALHRFCRDLSVGQQERTGEMISMWVMHCTPVWKDAKEGKALEQQKLHLIQPTRAGCTGLRQCQMSPVHASCQGRSMPHAQVLPIAIAMAVSMADPDLVCLCPLRHTIIHDRLQKSKPDDLTASRD